MSEIYSMMPNIRVIAHRRHDGSGKRAVSVFAEVHLLVEQTKIPGRQFKKSFCETPQGYSAPEGRNGE
jgi:hypothetical protein